MTQVKLELVFEKDAFDLIADLGNGDFAEGMQFLLQMAIGYMQSQAEKARDAGHVQ